MTKTEIIRATYTISSSDPEKACRLIAREMSVGIKKTDYESSGSQSFEAHARILEQGKWSARIQIEVPSQRIFSAYGLVLSIAGEISCLNILRSIELVDFEAPESLLSRFPGPQFGSAEIDKRRKSPQRPLLITVLKPSQGLSPKEFGHIAYESLMGGGDVVKSDELLQEPDADYRKRLAAMVEAAKRAEEETGEPKWAMMHPVDQSSRMLARYRAGAEAGAKISMVSPAASGFPMLEELARTGLVPIMAHMATSDWLWQKHGMSVRAWARFMRMLGADLILFPALSGTLKSRRSHLKTISEMCRLPMGAMKPSLIAVGGGMHAGTLGVHARLFGADFAYICGGGVCGHPDGARAGARSVRQAWEAHASGIPLESYRKTHKELDRALTAFQKYV
ncbi:MAG: RuBisCO large subunit C-terminal-like domain-containing protein [Leptospirillia bacterium]